MSPKSGNVDSANSAKRTWITFDSACHRLWATRRTTYAHASARLRLLRDIPEGHKFALAKIPKGDYVIKYGEPGSGNCE